jgi:hypothetical protein
MTASEQKVFDALIDLHADKTSELYKPDGSQRTGANVRIYFWHGYNGEACPRSAGGLGKAAWHAGKECRRRAGGRPAMADEDKPKVHSVRLNDARWAKFQTLGRGWLEAAIDDA